QGFVFEEIRRKSCLIPRFPPVSWGNKAHFRAYPPRLTPRRADPSPFLGRRADPGPFPARQADPSPFPERRMEIGRILRLIRRPRERKSKISAKMRLIGR